MLTGTWWLGFGLQNLNGLDGDHTIHLLPVGLFFCTATCWNVYFLKVATLTQSALWKYLNFMSNFFPLLPSLSSSLFSSWKSSIVTNICWNYDGLEHILMLLQVNFITFFIFLLFCFIYFFNLPKFIQVWSAACWSFQENSVCWWDHLWGAFLGK